MLVHLVVQKITPKEVNLRIDVPIHDNKKINDMYLVAMIKGEYQIKKIDAQNEIKKGDKKVTVKDSQFHLLLIEIPKLVL